MMFRSMFARLLCAFAIVAVLTIAAMGVLSLQMMRRQNETESIARLQSAAQELRWLYEQTMEGRVTLRAMATRMYELSDSINATVWLINKSGETEASGDVVFIGGSTEAEANSKVRLSSYEVENYLNKVLQQGHGEAFTNAFDDRFGTQTITYVEPVWPSSAWFVHQPIQLQQEITHGMAIQVAWVTCFIGALSVLLIWFIVRRVSQPMLTMAKAAERFSNGDFEARVSVKGRDEVARLATVFNRMAEDLSGMDQLRRGFVANVSHELRSPVTSIQGYIGAILDGTIPEAQQREYLQIVLDETKRLAKLISELLDLSRLESGKFPLKTAHFDVNELIRRVLIGNMMRIEEKGIQLHVQFAQDTCYAEADSARIEQVVYNLLDNALKFAESEITIWTRSAEERVLVGIQDDGPGVDAEDVPYLFERFYKADKAHSGMGTGLGLSIVKLILEQHGQSIKLTSAPGEGAKFVFTLAKGEAPSKLTSGASGAAPAPAEGYESPE